jgi:hypothetical protein
VRWRAGYEDASATVAQGAGDAPGRGQGKLEERDGALPVNVFEMGALLRRHFVAVLAVLLLAAWIVHDFKATPTVWTDGATAIFNPPASTRYPNPYESGGGSIITASGIIATYVNGSEGQKLVTAAGGTMPYDVELINSYNQDYPDYSAPAVNVSVTGTDLGSVMRTYAAVIKVIYAQVNARQAAAKAPKVDRIKVQLVGNPGPLAQPGSSKRTLGGLMLLTLVGIFAVAIFFERHPIRLGELSRSRRGTGRPSFPATRRGTTRA